MTPFPPEAGDGTTLSAVYPSGLRSFLSMHSQAPSGEKAHLYLLYTSVLMHYLEGKVTQWLINEEQGGH